MASSSSRVDIDELRALYPESDLTYWTPVHTQAGRSGVSQYKQASFVPTHRVRCRAMGSKPRAFTHTDYVALERLSEPAPFSWGWTPAPVGSHGADVTPRYALDNRRGVWQALWGGPFIVEANELRGGISGQTRELVGSVYFVQAGGPGGPVKIGWSTDVARRVPELQTANADKLVLLATTPGTLLTERAFHHRFGQYRLEAEWFEPAPGLITVINTLRGLGLTPPRANAG